MATNIIVHRLPKQATIQIIPDTSHNTGLSLITESPHTTPVRAMQFMNMTPRSNRARLARNRWASCRRWLMKTSEANTETKPNFCNDKNLSKSSQKPLNFTIVMVFKKPKKNKHLYRHFFLFRKAVKITFQPGVDLGLSRVGGTDFQKKLGRLYFWSTKMIFWALPNHNKDPILTKLSARQAIF